MKTGKKYVPTDNSYLMCLTKVGKDRRLAGTMIGDRPVIVTIISEPFIFQPEERYSTNDLYFVLVKDEFNDVYAVIFDIKGLDVEKTIAEFDARPVYY